MRILFLCGSRERLSDIEAIFQLDMPPYAYNGVGTDRINRIDSVVASFKPDRIVFYSDMLQFKDNKVFADIEKVACAKTKEHLVLCSDAGLPCVGVADAPSEIVQVLHLPGTELPDADVLNEAEGGQEEAADNTDVPADPFSGQEQEEQEPEPAEQQPEPAAQKTVQKEYKAQEMESLDDDEYEDINSIIYQAAEESHTAVRENRNTENHDQNRNIAREEFLRDVHGEKRNTKVISVYAAKGGIGKTTISTELAVYLSLIDAGKDRLKVCIVDCNIDFGDVKATLGLENDKRAMNFWADEIRERLKNGESPDSIIYTREEMDKWLIRDEKCGLYVLAAPDENKDSIFMKTEEVEIIVTNVINNGGFDYVIFDTGNNTRDVTVTPIEKSDIILMVVTQSMNAVKCNKSFIETMQAVRFDLSKVYLVMNNILPTKVTGISVDSIEKYFKEAGITCIAKIDSNLEVIKASNMSKPLAYSPDSKFTRQLREAVRFILEKDKIRLQENTEKEAPPKKKKGLFSFLKKN